MIELERSSDGFLKSCSEKVAKKALSKSKGRKLRNQNYWKLPEDSNYKLDKDGLLIPKAIAPGKKDAVKSKDVDSKKKEEV